ncbi:MAG: LPS export ABC transporter periplasmic protein LptC, partial [Gammaproteobacteria bacterium]|nr:LPS export ABC transporter periplasmic protein LptC [Gammaproteobacteria bacterium]
SAWLIRAETGRLQHKEEQFTLQQQVKLSRNSPQQPMQLTTDLMILKAHNNLIEIPQSMQVTASNLSLQAASAVLNIDQNRYQFKRVNATYTPLNTDRVNNEQS